IGEQMPFAAGLGPIGGVGAGVHATSVGPAGGAVQDGALQVEQAALAEQGDQVDVGLVPDAGPGPGAEAAPAGGACACAHLLGEGLPADTLAQDVEDAAQAVLVGEARAPALGGVGVLGQGEGEGVPQLVDQ